MPKYAAKCTVYLQIDSDYADGLGEAQHQVEFLVGRIKTASCAKVSIAHATDIEILSPKLREEPGECTNKLFFGDVCLDDGMR